MKVAELLGENKAGQAGQQVGHQVVVRHVVAVQLEPKTGDIPPCYCSIIQA